MGIVRDALGIEHLDEIRRARDRRRQ